MTLLPPQMGRTQTYWLVLMLRHLPPSQRLGVEANPLPLSPELTTCKADKFEGRGLKGTLPRLP